MLQNNNLPAIREYSLLSLIKNPFLGEVAQVRLGTGILFEVICAYLDKANISHRILKRAEIMVNGRSVPWREWKSLRLADGDVIAVCPEVRGGGGDGKNPLATILMVVVAVVAIAVSQGMLSPVLGPAFGGGMAGAQILSTAIMLGGSLLIGYLFPPNTPSLSALPTYDDAEVYAIQATQNQQRPYDSLPLVVGKMRVAPDFAARPYTVLSGNDQYLYNLYMVSAGEVAVSDLRIGDTPIGNYSGASVVVHQAWRGEALTWFNRKISEVSENVALTQARAYVVRTTPPNTKAVNIFVAFNRGLTVIHQDGTREETGVNFQVDYRPTGSGAWTSISAGRPVYAATMIVGDSFGGFPNHICVFVQDSGYPALAQYLGYQQWGSRGYWVDYNDPRIIARIYIEYSDNHRVDLQGKYYSGSITAGTTDDYDMYVQVGAGSTAVVSSTFSKSGKTVSLQRCGYMLNFPSAGQWDYRIKRLTADPDSNDTTRQILNESVLAGVQYHIDSPSINYRGRAYTLIELQLKASEELSGNVNAFNCLAQSYGQVPSGNTFVRQLSQNPAALALELMTSSDTSHRPVPWARVDNPAWRDFYNFCVQYGWKFNNLYSDGGMVGEKVRDMLASGLGGINRNKTLYSVAWDAPDRTPVDSVNQRLAWGFEMRKEFPTERIDGLRMEFVNEAKNYQVDERLVYADGVSESSAQNVQQWKMLGVTDSGLVWKHGRLRLAAIQLRAENYSWNTDWRGIDYQRGQAVKLDYDTLKVGVVSAGVAAYVMSADGSLCSGVTLDNAFNMEAGLTYVLVDNSKGSQATWPLMTIEGNSNEAYFAAPIPRAQAPKENRIVTVGIAGREFIEVIIQEVDPQENFTAKIKALPAAPAILQAIDGPIPPWDSLITDDSYYQRGKPNPPYIQNVRSDETVLLPLPGGILAPRIAVAFDLPQQQGIVVQSVSAQIREKDAGEEWRSAGSVDGQEREIYINEVVEGRTYQIRLRAISALGVASDWVETENMVIGMTSLPPDILIAYPEDSKIKIVYNQPLDFAGYEVFMAYAHNATVQQAVLFSDGLFSTSPIDVSGNLQGERGFFIYAVDLAGNRGQNPAIVRLQYEGARDGNVILTIDHKANGFPGQLIGGQVDEDGNLAANETTYFWDDYSNLFWDSGDADEYWSSSRYTAMEYITSFSVPADAINVSKHFLARQIQGQILSIDYNISDYKEFWSSDEALFWAGDTAAFWPMQWAPLPDNLPVTFSYLSIRIRIAGGLVQGKISQLVSEFDVPDIEEVIENLQLTAGWNTIATQRDFRAIKYADCIIFETPELDPITINKKISGGQLALMPVDSNGNPTQAVVNLIIRGY